MGTDVLYPNIDPRLPSELSPIFMTDILRNELHYDGVVVTDALYMKGITNPTPPYYKGVDQFTAAVMSIAAGCDMIDTSFTLENSLALVARIKQALDAGELKLAQIEQSDLRVLRLKINHGLIPFHPTGTPPQPQFFALGPMDRSVAAIA
jgi:beta-N-acetylhexosaminidase